MTIIHALLTSKAVKTTIQNTAWMGKYIPLIHVDAITNPCPYPNAGIANLKEMVHWCEINFMV